MICESFDPITGNVVPCCGVCSHKNECTKKDRSGADNTEAEDDAD